VQSEFDSGRAKLELVEWRFQMHVHAQTHEVVEVEVEYGYDYGYDYAYD